MKHLLRPAVGQLSGISFLSRFGVSPNHMPQHLWAVRGTAEGSVSVGLSEPSGCFVFHSEPFRLLWPEEKQVVWASALPCGPPFLISFFWLSSHALFAFLGHHSKEMPFLRSHTPSLHFLSQGSCLNGNTVGFLVLPRAVLILALVFTNEVINGDLSAFLAPHLCKRKSCLSISRRSWVIRDDLYAAESSTWSININFLTPL